MLTSIEVLISRASSDSDISHDEFILVNNALKENDDMSKPIKKFKSLNSSSNIIICLCHNIVWSVEKIWKSKTQKVVKIKKEKLLLFSKCGAWDSKTSRFLKKQEAGGLLSNLRLKTLLSKISLLGKILL